MVFEDSTSCQQRCVYLCNNVERLIVDWTSPEALEIVKRRLQNLTDSTEIFARIACILFYREILDGSVMKCKRDNLKKAAVAFSFASSFANEDEDCQTFYASCWKRFQELASSLEKGLCHVHCRQLFPMIFFIEQVFAVKLNHAPDALLSEIPVETNVQELVDTVFATERTMKNGRSPLNHSTSEAVQITSSQLGDQIEHHDMTVEVSGSSRSREATRSMPSVSPKQGIVKKAESEEKEKKPETRELMRSPAPEPVAKNNAIEEHLHSQTVPVTTFTSSSEIKQEPVEQCDSPAFNSAVPNETSQSQTVKIENTNEMVGQSSAIDLVKTEQADASIEKSKTLPNEIPVTSGENRTNQMQVSVPAISIVDLETLKQTTQMPDRRHEADGQPQPKRARCDDGRIECCSREDLALLQQEDRHCALYLSQNLQIIQLYKEQIIKKHHYGFDDFKLPPCFTINTATITDRKDWYKCPIEGCGYKFKHDWLLKRHIDRNLHPKRFNLFTCSECGMDFSKPCELAIHLNDHNKKFVYSCNICDFRFRRRIHLRSHVEICHPNAVLQAQPEERCESGASFSGAQKNA